MVVIMIRQLCALQISVRVMFRPGTAGEHESVVVVRNNLTVVDTVRLTGRGGQGSIKFANRSANSASPLTFNLAAKHLQDCEGET